MYPPRIVVALAAALFLQLGLGCKSEPAGDDKPAADEKPAAPVKTSHVVVDSASDEKARASFDITAPAGWTHEDLKQVLRWYPNKGGHSGLRGDHIAVSLAACTDYTDVDKCLAHPSISYGEPTPPVPGEWRTREGALPKSFGGATYVKGAVVWTLKDKNAVLKCHFSAFKRRDLLGEVEKACLSITPK